MKPAARNNVQVRGSGVPSLVFAHGYGCDQNMWRYVTPAFEADYRVVLFDHVGHGGSAPGTFDADRHSSLAGFANDVVEFCEELGLNDAVFVGHSVSAMIGILAALQAPHLFEKLVLIGPSPRYINDDGYTGGFKREDIEGLLDFLESNHLGWSTTMAPVIMGNPERPELGEELSNSFCNTDPEIAKAFARVTFLSDNRADLPKLRKNCLILQCSNDAIAPEAVGRYVHEHLVSSELVLMKATGHCPNLSAPQETVAAIKTFLEKGNRSA